MPALPALGACVACLGGVWGAAAWWRSLLFWGVGVLALPDGAALPFFFLFQAPVK